MGYGIRQPLAGKRAVFNLGGHVSDFRTWLRNARGDKDEGAKLGEFVVMKRRG